MRASVSPVFFILVIAISSVSKITASCPCDEDDVYPVESLAMIQCSKQHQISREAVESIRNQENVPDDYEVKCWLHCVMKKLGMMKEDKIDWEQCKTMIKQDLTSEIEKEKVDKIVEICHAQGAPEDEECQTAYSAVVCIIKQWKEFGLPNRNMEQ